MCNRGVQVEQTTLPYSKEYIDSITSALAKTIDRPKITFVDNYEYIFLVIRI